MSDWETDNIVNVTKTKRVRGDLLHRTRVVWEWNGRGLARTHFEQCPEESVCPLNKTPRCPYYKPDEEPQRDKHPYMRLIHETSPNTVHRC